MIISPSGGQGIEIEHRVFTLADFEEFLLQLIGFLDSIEAVQKSGENKTVKRTDGEISSI